MKFCFISVSSRSTFFCWNISVTCFLKCKGLVSLALVLCIDFTRVCIFSYTGSPSLNKVFELNWIERQTHFVNIIAWCVTTSIQTYTPYDNKYATYSSHLIYLFSFHIQCTHTLDNIGTNSIVYITWKKPYKENKTECMIVHRNNMLENTQTL